MPNVISKPSLTKETFIVGSIALGLVGAAAGLYFLHKDGDSYDLEQPGSRIKTSKQVTIDVKIPKEFVGVVIGRQGSNIREIQTRTETKIHFRDELETDSHRVCCVRGLAEDVQMAEILIQQTISQQPRLESLVMTVPSGCCGRIIGRQGDTIRDIQRISGAKVDVERGDSLGGVNSMERRITIKGTSKQISGAKEMIEEKVGEEESMRTSLLSSRQPRVKQSPQPLFLSYSGEEDSEQPLSLVQPQEILEVIAGDNAIDVMVSGVETPSEFWVQKVGPKSRDLDKMTQTMTDFYSELPNRKLLALNLERVKVGDIVAARFSQEESYYRAKVVSIKEDSYDASQSRVELFYVDYGDTEEKEITEVYELKTEYLKLKYQAIQCSIAHIKPEPGPAWSTESVDLFCELTHCAMWKFIYARIVEYDVDNNPVVELLDNQGDVNIGAEMVERGLASW